MDKPASGDDAQRRHFACPPRRGHFQDLDLSLLDPADPDDRRVLILSEHPDMAEAIERGEHELVIDGEPMNPNLDITFHEVTANQLWDDTPPEVWQAARRLLAAGLEPHDIMHALATAVAGEMWQMLHEQAEFDRERYVRALEEAVSEAAPSRRGGRGGRREASRGRGRRRR